MQSNHPGEEDQTYWEKENDPKRWMSYTYHAISNLVDEYNKVATEQKANLIGAFTMTPAEYKEMFEDAKSKDN